VKFHIPSLLVGALVAGGQASATPADDAMYDKTRQEAHAAADKWRDEIKQSFQSSQKHEAHLKAMQESSGKLRAFLVGMVCRDGAQAKEIETYIHGRFHTLYGSVVADIKHGVDLNCRQHQLFVTFWITDFTPNPQTADLENTNASLHEVEAATKRVLGNWATAVVPSLTDKSKKIEDIRAWAIRASEQTKAQIQAISCYDMAAATTGTKANLAAATKDLSQNFTGYTFDISCSAKKLNLYYNFSTLKRKGT
jgi:hypothetical protein